MKVETLGETPRIQRIVEAVAMLLNAAQLPDVNLKETVRFSIAGGTIKSFTDESEMNVVSIVDELQYSEILEQFVPRNVVDVFASKFAFDQLKPTAQWCVPVANINELAGVVALFFLSTNHKFNRHFSREQLRVAMNISQERWAVLTG